MSAVAISPGSVQAGDFGRMSASERSRRNRIQFACVGILSALALLCSCTGDATAQERGLHRPLQPPQGQQKPLEQFRTLLQLQRAGDFDELLRQFREQLDLSDEQLHSLAAALGSPGGLSAADLPDALKKGARTRPQLLEQAVRLRQQIAGLPEAELLARQLERMGITDLSSLIQPQDSRTNGAGASLSPSVDVLRHLPDIPTWAWHHLSDAFSTGTSNGIPRVPSTDGQQDVINAIIEYLRNSKKRQERTEQQSSSTDRSFDIGRELSRSGVTSTLRHLIRDASKQVKQQSRSAGAATSSKDSRSGWNAFIMKALDGVREDLAEVVNDLRKSKRGARARSTDLQALSQAGHTAQSDAGESSEGLLQEPASAASETDSEPATYAAGGSAATSTPGRTSGSRETSMAIVLVALTVCAFCLATIAFHHYTQRERKARDSATPPVSPADIRKREDIVRVVHWLARRSPGTAPNWWHHRQALNALIQNQPGLHDPVQVLADLYETARYRPADRPLESTELQAARTALSGCLS